jgi:hypothetical protein
VRPDLALSLGAWASRPARPAGQPPPDHTPAEAREAADRILARREYQWSDDRSLLERIFGPIVDWLDDVLGSLSPFGSGLPVVVGWLLLGALIGALAYLVVRSRGGWARRGRVEVAPGARVVVTDADRHVDWAAEAERCEREGRWGEAVRARYRVLVGELARRAVLGDLVGRTAGELVAELRTTAPAAAPSFVAATDLFEAAWYGGAPMGPDDLARLRSLAGSVLAAVGGRRPGTTAGPAGSAGPAGAAGPPSTSVGPS